MKRNKKLFLAWSVFLTILFLFILVTEICHYHNRHLFDYQFRILINQDFEITESVKDLDSTQKKKNNTDTEFYDETKYGYLPKISRDGVSVFEKYSACLEISSKKELRVAVLVNDNSKVDDLNLKLNNQKITFILSHHLDHLKDIVKMIKKHGHEFFIQMPTQSSESLVSVYKKGTISPFLANANIEDTLDNLLNLLGSTKYALGIANVSPTLFTKSEKNMTVVANELSKRGLAFLNFEKSDDLLKSITEKSGLIYIKAITMFEVDNFDISKLKDGDILILKLNHLDDLIKVLPPDWLLTPISASVRR